MKCNKCGNNMYAETYKNVFQFSCLICGNVEYPGFPKRSGERRECIKCGAEFEGRVNSNYCSGCVPKQQKLCACGMWFTPTQGNQKYHDKECAKYQRKLKRQIRRKNKK